MENCKNYNPKSSECYLCSITNYKLVCYLPIKTLTLTIKKKWFDMILSGEKKEEYRELKSYWLVRLFMHTTEGRIELNNIDCTAECIIEEIESFMEDVKEGEEDFKNFKKEVGIIPIEFTHVLLKNGYSKNSPSLLIECKGIDIGEAVPEWSDNWQGNVFRIKLGQIIEKII